MRKVARSLLFTAWLVIAGFALLVISTNARQAGDFVTNSLRPQINGDACEDMCPPLGDCAEVRWAGWRDQDCCEFDWGCFFKSLTTTLADKTLQAPDVGVCLFSTH